MGEICEWPLLAIIRWEANFVLFVVWLLFLKKSQPRPFSGNPKDSLLYKKILSILDSKDKIPYITKIFEHYYNFWQDENHPRGLWWDILWRLNTDIIYTHTNAQATHKIDRAVSICRSGMGSCLGFWRSGRCRGRILGVQRQQSLWCQWGKTDVRFKVQVCMIILIDSLRL